MAAKFSKVDPFDLVVFGGTGDLAYRKLYPALFHRDIGEQLSDPTRIIGVSRRPLTPDAFRRSVREALLKHNAADATLPEALDRFLRRLDHLEVDAASDAGWDNLRELLGADERIRAYYMATGPDLFGPIAKRLGAAGLATPRSRIIVEKPIGRDGTSAAAINDAIGSVFLEKSIFRIDHYLGKESVQNLMALRFANALLEPLWNNAYIDHAQITVAETLGVEGRGAYYEQAGALRDMVQNHMLQLLALTAMEPPARFDATSVRDEKVKVLRSLRPIDRETAATHSVIGQYIAGAVAGRPVKGYADDLGRASTTETFVALKAHVDNWRWRGTPFYMRTGKRLPARSTEIFIQFKAVPHSIFSGSGAALQPNKLIIRLQPEEAITLRVMLKEPGLDRAGMRLREAPLDISIPNAFADSRRRIAYERLLLDLLDGDPTLFVRRDEVEAQWTWIDAIRAGWAANAMTPKSYAAGAWGPSAAIGLTERDGVTWHDP